MALTSKALLLKAHSFRRLILSDSQLQGAQLNFAQLQGAKLTGTKLEATSLYGAPLQGASLQEATISATQLSYAFLWRTNSSAPIIRLGEGHPQVISLKNAKWAPVWSASGNDALPWSDEAYQALKRMMEPLAPQPSNWDNEMVRLSRLDCAGGDRTLASCDLSANIPPEAANWRRALEDAQVDNSTFARAWTEGIKAVLCTDDDNGTFYFAGGRSSISRQRFR
jgi:hypothetical protein